MKKILALLLAAGLFTIVTAGAAIAAEGAAAASGSPELPRDFVFEVRELPCDFVFEVLDWPIFVDGVQIDAPPALRTDGGCRMVPLRAIAEALGYEVRWDEVTRGITLNDTISLWIGVNRYEIGDRVIDRDCDYTITTFPILRGNHAYVPFCFFRDKLGLSYSTARGGSVNVYS